MKTFVLAVREVWVQLFEIEAESKEDAKTRVHRGEGTAVDNSLEYSHTLDPETWTVDEDS